MDFITFRTNDLLLSEFDRIRQNEAEDFYYKKRPVAQGIQSTVETYTPSTFFDWKMAINQELKNGY